MVVRTSLEKRGRISLAERSQALTVLGERPIPIDQRTAALACGPLLALASGQDLTVYNACYLELALRLGLPIASPDKCSCQAARVPLIITS